MLITRKPASLDGAFLRAMSAALSLSTLVRCVYTDQYFPALPRRGRPLAPLRRRREAHATVQACAKSDSNERVVFQLPRLCSNDVDPSGAAYSRARTAVRPGKAEAESQRDSS